MHPEYGPVLDVAIIGAGMAGLCGRVALRAAASVGSFDEAPAGLEGPGRRPRAWRRCVPEGARRAGARHSVADLSRLVRGAVRARRLGRARQDPAPAMDGLPALVPPGARRAGRERASCHRPRRRRRLGRAGARGRAPARAAWARRSCSPPAAPASAGLGPPMFRGLDAPLVAHSSDDNDSASCAACGRRDRRRRVGDGQRRDRARGRRRAGRPAGAPARPAAHQQGQGHRQSGLLERASIG